MRNRTLHMAFLHSVCTGKWRLEHRPAQQVYSKLEAMSVKHLMDLHGLRRRPRITVYSRLSQLLLRILNDTANLKCSSRTITPILYPFHIQCTAVYQRKGPNASTSHKVSACPLGSTTPTTLPGMASPHFTIRRDPAGSTRCCMPHTGFCRGSGSKPIRTCGR